MCILFITTIILISTFLCFSIAKLIENNIKIISFKSGMFPQKTGRYYIILNDKTLTSDFYNADRLQWSMTKNPTSISHFAEYGE